ncbi:helix-turn-helix transcriptional regulator (plasmid) [Ralstonia solanacearum]|uniref:Putative transcription regulator protein n=1 Tax=Ralstonia solanacearum TaxID=305 RepID=A0A0S4V9U6_RALSL|nr:helix-turn-helix transcriptional regulator [Ralstonia pseudosolanacearum]QIK26670.1 helix-turn-helix transcriptional regulator [Ralstonia solanacearum]ASL76330.1 helix-turn-helix transcriptional regulator [Ralstonia pseudosolanacearum]MCK4119885.1 helix-turn-helix transcriptional regulator [Ralstonia pseudosolanacearum]QIK31403.1 helix-turn-helix transcriptional regulator [Ralstonia solanacearum]QIK35630.1 helix-turn-helix transcriptional regulator [Ralstonia solanacearum]
MDLTTTDLRTLLDITGALHEPSADSFVDRPDVVGKLSALLHADIVGHLVWADRGRRLLEPGAWGRDGGMNLEYRAHFQAVDPIAPLLRSCPGPLVIERLIGRNALQCTEYFADFLARYKVYPGVSMYLEDADGTLLDYRFGTSDPGKRFGEREVTLLTLLQPHLLNAQRLRQTARAEREAACAGADGACFPCFLLVGGRPPQPDRRALALMAGLDAHEREALLDRLARIGAGAPAQLRWNGFNLCVERPPRGADGQPWCQVHLLAHTVGSAAWLQQRFGMTLREGEVCHLMLQGQSDKQIALALRISYWTVRAHVGRVLDKLGVESRSAIGRAVLSASRCGPGGDG